MELGLVTTFVGLSVVFIALILLSVIIGLFTRVLNKNKRTQKSSLLAHDHQASVLELDEDAAEAQSGPQEEWPEEELVAVLTAAVMANMGSKTQSKIRVKSFRRIPVASPVWNVTGRKENIINKL